MDNSQKSQQESKEAEIVSKIKARQVMGQYLEDVKKKWEDHGLPTESFEDVRTRNTLLDGLVSELEKNYRLADLNAKRAYIVSDILSTFVKAREGSWDHAQWEALVREIKEKATGELSDNVKDAIGVVLESWKGLYFASFGTSKALVEMGREIVEFIQEKNGVWGHSEWLELLEMIRSKGIDVTDQTNSYVGQILEATRALYGISLTNVEKTDEDSSPITSNSKDDSGVGDEAL